MTKNENHQNNPKLVQEGAVSPLNNILCMFDLLFQINFSKCGRWFPSDAHHHPSLCVCLSVLDQCGGSFPSDAHHHPSLSAPEFHLQCVHVNTNCHAGRI